MESSMFDTLLSLPLFQGMAQTDFDSLLQKVKLDFARFQPGDMVTLEGDRCDRFAFLMNGTVESSRGGDCGRFVFKEKVTAPCIIEPYSMFGRSCQYKRSYQAETQCNFLFIDKQYVYTEIGKYNVCRMNLLNILSGKVDRQDRMIWNLDCMELKNRIIRFIASLSDHRHGEKTLLIKMNDLADIMDTTRLNVSKELNAMEENGLVTLGRGTVFIPDLEKLKNQR